MRNPETSARLAAYHEAGHAVACHFRWPAVATTRISIRKAELDREDAGMHCCRRIRPVGRGHDAALDEVRASAVVALAGAEVDRRLTGNAWTSAGSDYEAVRELLFRAVLDEEIEEAVAAVTPEEAAARGLEEIAAATAVAIEEDFKRLFDELQAEARSLIETKWSHVEAVAEALLEREALSGDEVRAILERVEARAPARAPGPAASPPSVSARRPRA